MKIFVDSNIWLYSFMSGSSDKHQVSVSLIKNNNVFLSTQVVNEICINLIKKSEYSEDDVTILIKNLYDRYNIFNIDKQTILQSSVIRKNYSCSYWDSLIISSALENNCKYLFSEDMQHKQIIFDNLIIIDPFQ